MNVTVRFFASARDRAGTDHATIDLPDGADLAGLKEAVAAQFKELAPHLDRVRWALDLEFAGDDATLSDGVEIAVIPPVSGG